MSKQDNLIFDAPSLKPSILFRCDGSPEIGLGHVVRCLALADELRDRHSCHIIFAMRKGPLGIKMVEEKGYHVITSQETDENFNYANWFNKCVKEVGAKGIIFDVRDGLKKGVLKSLRSKGIIIVTIDDPEEKRLEADLAFYPPVPQIKRATWTDFKGELFTGWEWVILKKEFNHLYRPCPVIPCSVPHKIMITMGGSDPHGLTYKAIEGLDRLEEEFNVIVVLGAGFQKKKLIGSMLTSCKHRFDIYINVQNMSQLMSECDLAIASFGVTAYELAAVGVPAIYLCLTEDHAESASVFMEAGMGISLGVYKNVSPDTITRETKKILRDRVICQENTPINKYIDGQGAMRIARVLMERLNS